MTRWRTILAALAAGLAAGAAGATAQIPDRITYEGQAQALYAQPIHALLEARPDLRRRVERRIGPRCSASWSGLRAEWLVEHDRLYLVGLEANPCEREPDRIPLRKLGARRGEARLFADWFSGELRLPQGAEREYVHMGFESVYERDLFLTIEQGRVVGRRVVENPPPRPPPEPPVPGPGPAPPAGAGDGDGG